MFGCIQRSVCDDSQSQIMFYLQCCTCATSWLLGKCAVPRSEAQNCISFSIILKLSSGNLGGPRNMKSFQALFLQDQVGRYTVTCPRGLPLDPLLKQVCLLCFVQNMSTTRDERTFTLILKSNALKIKVRRSFWSNINNSNNEQSVHIQWRIQCFWKKKNHCSIYREKCVQLTYCKSPCRVGVYCLRNCGSATFVCTYLLNSYTFYLQFIISSQTFSYSTNISGWAIL